eukprot:958206_1
MENADPKSKCQIMNINLFDLKAIAVNNGYSISEEVLTSFLNAEDNATVMFLPSKRYQTTDHDTSSPLTKYNLLWSYRPKSLLSKYINTHHPLCEDLPGHNQRWS